MTSISFVNDGGNAIVAKIGTREVARIVDPGELQVDTVNAGSVDRDTGDVDNFTSVSLTDADASVTTSTYTEAGVQGGYTLPLENLDSDNLTPVVRFITQLQTSSGTATAYAEPVFNGTGVTGLEQSTTGDTNFNLVDSGWVSVSNLDTLDPTVAGSWRMELRNSDGTVTTTAADSTVMVAGRVQ